MSSPRSVFRLRTDALDAWHRGVLAASPARSVEQFLSRRPALRSSLGRSFALATGKAAAAMMRGLGPGARGAVLLPPEVSSEGLPPGVRVFHGGHPLPTEEGLSASRDLLAAVSALGERDRLLYLVSGGTSSLFEVPHPGLDHADLIEAYRVLLGSGAPITQLNVVRRALSTLKGGGLAVAAHPASVLTLAVSDVTDDEPSAIGSGPTVPVDDGVDSALAVIERYGLGEKLPDAALEVATGRTLVIDPQPPVRIDGYHVIASIAQSEDAVCDRLEALGYEVVAPPVVRLEGDALGAGLRIAAGLESRLDEATGLVAFVTGGETTVRLPRNPGVGGRNQHMAAVIAAALACRGGFACMVGGTDGRDGTSTAAGGLVDGDTAERAAAAGHDLRAAIASFDSATALAVSGDSVDTGPTDTNVGDLLVVTMDGRC